MPAIVQKPAPTFSVAAVENGMLTDIALESYLSKSWVVLLFYPLDFTFVCPTEILAFNDALPQFKELQSVVLGISTDSEYCHLAWSSAPRSAGGLGPGINMPLLADKNMAICRDYGVLIEEKGIAQRGLFIIDPKGILRQSTVNDLPVGRSVDETLRLIRALQFTDEHGEVCPVNWTPGAKTIKPDPKGSLEYFSGDTHKLANGSSKTLKRPAAEADAGGEKKARID